MRMFRRLQCLNYLRQSQTPFDFERGKTSSVNIVCVCVCLFFKGAETPFLLGDFQLFYAVAVSCLSSLFFLHLQCVALSCHFCQSHFKFKSSFFSFSCIFPHPFIHSFSGFSTCLHFISRPGYSDCWRQVAACDFFGQTSRCLTFFC